MFAASCAPSEIKNDTVESLTIRRTSASMQRASVHNDTLTLPKEKMGAALSTRRIIACPDSKGYGMCVAVQRGLLVVSDHKAKQLVVYSLIDGVAVRRFGSRGSGKGQFNFGCGGLCVSPDGDSVLVADHDNNRIQEIRIVDGSWVRYAGEGVLNEPQYVDCNADVIVVSEWWDRISVLSWADGSPRAQFGSSGTGPGQLDHPCGARLLINGTAVAVADYGNNRVCLFTLSGELVAAIGSTEQGVNSPCHVLHCASDSSFVVANTLGHNNVKLSRNGVNAGIYGKKGVGNGEFCDPTSLAALPNEGCLVLDSGNRRVQHLAHLRARLAWMRACACRVI